MSESEVILKVENVSKQYRLGTVGTRTLSGDVHRWWTTKILGKEDPFLQIGAINDRTSNEKTDFVWALRDINFEVKRGEVLGIIGKNGAGKSTLLKLLSRITAPTTGSIKSNGRMASLLEVGTGFHPELTGRENIFLNGAILGMTKNEIKRKFDEIVDFSGCALYIDTPVKRYSSGMTVRLGFAVAAFLDPEILVVDEVLAVGDAEFQKKAIGKMQDISKGEGRTVLFVSHNMNSIKQLCTNGLLMQNGTIKNVNDIAIVIEEYLKQNDQKQLKNLPFVVNENLIVNLFEIKQRGSEVDVLIEFNLLSDMKDFRIGVKVIKSDGTGIIRTLLTDLNNDYKNLNKGKYKITSTLNLEGLAEGIYKVALHHSIYGIKDWFLEDSLYKDVEIIRPNFFNSAYPAERTLAEILTFNNWEIQVN
jgi:lipopolysaccharide transport system ATP-binding protein